MTPDGRAMRARVSKEVWRSMTGTSLADRDMFAVIAVTIVAKLRKYLMTCSKGINSTRRCVSDHRHPYQWPSRMFQ